MRKIQKRARDQGRAEKMGYAGKYPVATQWPTAHYRICSMARIRPGKRTKTAAVAAVARNIDFGHFWRQLRAVGWKYKRPTGIQTKGKYVSADGSKVLVGEEAVVAYALETGILDEPESAEEANAADDEVAVDVVADDDESAAASATEDAVTSSKDAADNCLEDVRASQIDTSAELSQQTMNDLFGTPSSCNSSEVELSQAAVTRAFNLSPGELRDAATNLQFLSSGPESDAQSDVGAASPPDSPVPAQPITVPTALPVTVPVAQPTREPDAQPVRKHASQPVRVPATPTCPVLRPRHPVKKDVNFVADDEDLSDYESFSSGDSDDDIEEDNDDDDGNDCEVPEELDELSEDDAVPMDAAFIDSLQVGSDALNSQAKQQREDALRSMEWSPVTHEFEEGVEAYSGLNMEEARPVAELLNVCHSPLLTFFYFMPKSLWVKIAAETNRYGLQQVTRRAERIHAKQHDRRKETVKQISRRLKAKPGYETHEILHVIGLLIARMLCPQKRRFAAHWSMVEDGAVPAGNFGRFMGRNRCQDMLRDLHFVDNEAERTRDRLWKLRMVVETMQNRFLIAWTLPAVFAFDEGVLPSTSKRNTTRMFMPDKPHRYG